MNESEGLSKIYAELHAEILTYVKSRSNLGVAAEDVVQDAFLKLYSTLKGGKTIQNPEAWLKRVSYNLLVDLHRSKTKTEGSLRSEGTAPSASKAHGPEDCLLGIISKLPYKYKKAVYLVDIQGMAQTEAAKRLQIPLPTCKSHVQRGRKLVKQGYVDCCDYSIREDGTLAGEAKDWEECKVCSH